MQKRYSQLLSRSPGGRRHAARRLPHSAHSLRWRNVATLLLPLLLITACATKKSFIPAPIVKPARSDGVDVAAGNALDRPDAVRETSFYKTPPPPANAKVTAGRPAPSTTGPADDGSKLLDASINLENLPLPQFINAVFASILKRNVSIDAQVLSRNDMVSLRTGKPQTAEQLSVAAKAVLRSYGVVVSDFDGLVRVTLDNAQSGALPEIRRGRASPDVPGALRPVFYLAELEHTNVNGTATWLRTLFPGKLNVQEDSPRNALLLSGQSDTVAAGLDAIRLLDQPLMRGRRSARITPAFWAADEMAKRLVDLLSAEGYFVSSASSAQSPILVIPVAPINSIVVFAANEALLNHTLHWAREIDQPNQMRASSSGYITYFARNTDAADLAKTLNEIMTGMPSSAPAASTAGGTPASRSSKVVVNAAANSLIIQASANDFQQLRGLLEELDRPARSALVMATVAEVYLDKSETFNFNWLLKQFNSHGYKYNVGTSNGKGLAAAASNFSVLLSGPAGDPRAVFSALASDNKVRILSNPSVMARSGESATIQVGSQVPIITSQVSNASTGTVSGSSGILQTVQYVQTGVILKVKPVVHAGGRIDLEVSQEVSSASPNTNGGTTSPVISNKKVDTKISVSDGGTVLMGGLISEENSRTKEGIPGMKDIPLLGGLFQTRDLDSTTRTELVIMLTSYAVEDDFDARSITDAFRAQFPWAANVSTDQLANRSMTGGSKEQPVVEAAEISSPPSPAAPLAPPEKAVRASRSQPYLLPDMEASLRVTPNTVPNTASHATPNATAKAVPDPAPNTVPDVAPIQQSAALPPPVAADSPLSSAPAVVDSAPSVAVVPPSGSKPVTDEKLKQELLEAIRGGGKSR